MGETITPQPEGPPEEEAPKEEEAPEKDVRFKGVEFKNAIEFWPEDQRTLARELQDISHRALTGKKRVMAYEQICSFAPQNPDGEDCALRHMTIGSSLTQSKWGQLPFDLPNGEYENFIRNVLAPLIEE